MKKMALILLIVTTFNNVKAQKTTDVVFIFKTQLFLELPNISNDNSEFKKDYLFFDKFINRVSIKLDTLTSIDDIVFLQLNQDNVKLSSRNSKLVPIILVGNNCNKYIMAIDTSSGMSFKLEGFDRNEFFAFFDYIKSFRQDIKTIKDFFNRYHVEGIDFSCIYQAAKSKEYNPKKYPCSKKCSDMLTIY